jgi:hypothetical protein
MMVVYRDFVTWLYNFLAIIMQVVHNVGYTSRLILDQFCILFYSNMVKFDHLFPLFIEIYLFLRWYELTR